MKPEIQRIYEETRENEARSRMDPYSELILCWRRQGKSYRTIIRLLAEKCSIQISKTPLMRFVQRRSRPRKQGEPDLMTRKETSGTATPYDEIFDHGNSSGKTRAEMLAFLAQEKAKPLAPKTVTEKLFEYTDEDASKPIKTRTEGEPI
jgi:hypothetical protein